MPTRKRLGTQDQPGLDKLIKSITRRVRPVCKQMPQSQFDGMVRRMAEIELKYADQGAPTDLDRTD